MKYDVNGIESDVLRKKVGFPWLLTFLVLLGFELNFRLFENYCDCSCIICGMYRDIIAVSIL